MLPGRKCVTIRGYNFEKSTVLVFNVEILTLPILLYCNWKGCFALDVEIIVNTNSYHVR